MKKNVGTIDKIIRVLLALIIASIGIYYQDWWGLLAIIPLATAFSGFCPAYCPLKLSTNKKEE